MSISFELLKEVDLIVDQIYDGGNAGNAGDEPISKLLPGTGNMGGFRTAKTRDGTSKAWVVLFTSGEDLDWPDSIDPTNGRFVYFGDNKTPGHSLHDTPKRGNLLLRDMFDAAHTNPAKAVVVPPIFIFSKSPNAAGNRSVRFLGLAVPGSEGLTHTEDLIAIWRTTDGKRFQNYKAIFTILDCPKIDRRWLNDLKDGRYLSEHAPKNWAEWTKRRVFQPLIAPPTKRIRSVAEQLPQFSGHKQMLREVWEYFAPNPWAFEEFAAWIFRISDDRVLISELTRRSVDGGRDAVGRYRLGLDSDPIFIDFSLEAKCYNPGLADENCNTVGVKEMSRLISRLRHRQFGVLVTTSAVAKQAYEEIRDDQHPIQVIAGSDIVAVLVSNGFSTASEVLNLLREKFPL
jgi:hypothetical protein